MLNRTFVWMLLMASMIFNGGGTPLLGDDDVAQRVVIASRCNSSPVIDGQLDDACWSDATVLDGFSVFKDANRMHPEQTAARVCYDDQNLYLAVQCDVNEMDKFLSRMEKTDGQYNYALGSVIELFFDTNHDGNTFQQYLLHANGSSSMTLPAQDILALLNEENITAKSSLTKNGFVIEVTIPFAMLHLESDADNIWGFNLTRKHDLYDEHFDVNGFYSAWNSTRGKGFQSPELFGELHLKDAELSRFKWNVAMPMPQVGDEHLSLVFKNNTGSDFTGQVRIKVKQLDGSVAVLEQALNVSDDATEQVSFSFRVGDIEAQAAYHVSLIDDVSIIRYLGGVQTRDVTPGDDWSPPSSTSDQQKLGMQLFARPWIQPVLYRSVPKDHELVESLNVDVCRSEYEPVTFSMYPLRDLASVRVMVSDLKSDTGHTLDAKHIDIRSVSSQSRWLDPRTVEAQEHLLRPFDTLTLTKGRSQRLWLTVYVPQETPPGIYRGKVSVTHEDAMFDVPLTVRVLPFELLQPKDMGYFMYYTGIKKPYIANPSFLNQILADMRAHGMTTFTIYSWVQNENGSLDLDQSVSDNLGVTYSELIDALASHGLGVDAPLLDVYSMHYKPQTIASLYKAYQQHNWPDVLFYIEDEIEYPERIKRARKTLTALRQTSLGIKTTTALGPIGAAALGDMYDVWIGCSSTDMIEKCLALGKAPWTYSCRATTDVGPAFERAFFGRFSWKIGLRGVSLWSYTDDNSFFDRFGRFHGYSPDFVFTTQKQQRYGHVVFEDGKIIPAVTWEAVREGIDDYRYMLTLKQLADQAMDGDSETRREIAQQALQLLNEIAERTPILADDKKYGRQVEVFGDMDGDRASIIDMILKLSQ